MYQWVGWHERHGLRQSFAEPFRDGSGRRHRLHEIYHQPRRHYFHPHRSAEGAGWQGRWFKACSGRIGSGPRAGTEGSCGVPIHCGVYYKTSRIPDSVDRDATWLKAFATTKPKVASNSTWETRSPSRIIATRH